MFKKIKQYFYLQRRIQIEILETLCSICLYLTIEKSRPSNQYARLLPLHVEKLNELSKELRDKENNR